MIRLCALYAALFAQSPASKAAEEAGAGLFLLIACGAGLYFLLKKKK